MNQVWGPLGWMTGTNVAAWLAVTSAGGAAIQPEALFGLLGPLASANASWVVMARTFLSRSGELMRVMVQALAVKMLLVGGYVVGMILVLDLRPLPFVTSFAGHFVALYAMEAWFLRRLLTSGAPLPRQ
jgi:hypothetical protein